jgi:hypothetical protein
MRMARKQPTPCRDCNMPVQVRQQLLRDASNSKYDELSQR